MRLHMALTAAPPACSYLKILLRRNQGWIQGALDGKAAAKVKGRIDNIMEEVRLAEGWLAHGTRMHAGPCLSSSFCMADCSLASALGHRVSCGLPGFGAPLHRVSHGLWTLSACCSLLDSFRQEPCIDTCGL